MTEKLPLIVIGTGGHARACTEVIESEGKFQIMGFIAQDNTRADFLNYPVLGTDDTLSHWRAKCCHAVIGVGQIKSADVRRSLFKHLKSLDFILPNIIASSAVVSKHATLQEGVVVMHNAMVNAGATIGENCIVNNFALVEHDVSVSGHCHIATRATLNGGVSVGEGTFVGSGALVRENVKIGSRVVVAMGERVFQNISDNTILRSD